jgi:hypothetical protein
VSATAAASALVDSMRGSENRLFITIVPPFALGFVITFSQLTRLFSTVGAKNQAKEAEK